MPNKISRLPQQVLIALVDAYCLLLSPWLGSQCRFEPTCSAYAREAIQTRGAMMGSILAVRRLLRCQPWCRGGHDPLPPISPCALTHFRQCADGHPWSARKRS